MKKSIILLLVFLTFLYFNINSVKAELDYSPQFNLTVQVVGLPSLIIESPRNEIYFSNESLKFRVISNGGNIWYNIDGGANFSLVGGEVFLNVGGGSHIINAFANNSYGITKRNVSFSVDSNLFKVIYNKYKGLTKGESSDFDSYSYLEVQNLQGVVLENKNYGKVSFFDNINLTDDFNFSDKVLDLDSNTEIAFNKISIDVGKLPNFNKNSSLSFYGLTFNNPRILLNGTECPLSICTLVSYIGGNLTFNAISLGTFSAEEIISGGGTPGGNGGSGGSSGGGGFLIGRNKTNILLKGEFSLDKDKIIVQLKQGEAKREQFTVENIGGFDLTVEVNNTLRDFFRQSNRRFNLKKEEKTTILLELLALESKQLGVYTGKIIVSSGSIIKDILFVVEVGSRNPLLDVKLKISEEYLKVKPGNEVSAEISLVNLERVGFIDAEINYLIKDMNDNVLFEENENIRFKDESRFFKNIVIPESAKTGEHVLYADVVYGEKTANASAFFKVVRYFWSIFFLTIILIVSIALLIYKYYRQRKDRIASLFLREIGKENIYIFV